MFLRISWAALLPVLVAVSPPLLMTVSSAASVIFYVLVLAFAIGLAGLACRPSLRLPGFWDTWKPLGVGMVMVVASVLASQLYHGQFSGAGLERAIRAAAILPVTWVLLYARPAWLRQIQWGILAGALTAAWLLLFPQQVAGSRPYTAGYTPYNSVTFGNLTLLFSVMAWLSIGWRLTRWHRTEIAVKLLAGGLGFAGFIASETRSGWLAIPVFLLIGVCAYNRVPWSRRLAAVGAAVAIGCGVIAANDALNDRVEAGVKQWKECQVHELSDTSVCVRLQLARAALEMWKASPVFGVGEKGFDPTLEALQKRGIVSADVARTYGETHNDMLYVLAQYGALGLLGGLLVIYLLPAWYFARRIGDGDRAIRTAAAMGLCICLGFAIFGLTELMFRGMRTVAFYSIWVGAMLALTYPRRDRATQASA